MRKRNILLSSIGLLIVVLVGVIIHTATRPSATPPTYAKAKNTASTEKCLAENTHLTIPTKDRDPIEMAALSYLIDVPAGTNVDIKIATHSSSEVTGSDRYPAKYGNYNFVMVKHSGNWVVTSFKRCV